MAVHTNNTIKLPAGGMDLSLTLQCGQTFSWRQSEPGQFEGVAGNYAVAARQNGDILLLNALDGTALPEGAVAFWHSYFALDVNYAAIQARMCSHKKLAECIAAAPGIRVLRQPFWDTLLSFIISQNNHIPRIMTIAQRLRTQFGPQILPGVFGFPSPRALAEKSVEDLQVLQAGYRAAYLLDAAQRVAAGQIKEEQMKKLTTAKAREMLLQIKGVGPKVADCVLLFGLGRSEVAPMDVWMKRAMAAAFGGKMPKAAKGCEGIAQQYIFHWARQNKLPQESKV